MSSAFCRIRIAWFGTHWNLSLSLRWPNGSRSKWGTALYPIQALSTILRPELQWTWNAHCGQFTQSKIRIKSISPSSTYQYLLLGPAFHRCLVRTVWSLKAVSRFPLWPIWWSLQMEVEIHINIELGDADWVRHYNPNHRVATEPHRNSFPTWFCSPLSNVCCTISIKCLWIVAGFVVVPFLILFFREIKQKRCDAAEILSCLCRLQWRRNNGNVKPPLDENSICGRYLECLAVKCVYAAFSSCKFFIAIGPRFVDRSSYKINLKCLATESKN